MCQRLDLEIDLPSEGGAWPILALREGARERTGLILASPGATVRKIAAQGHGDDDRVRSHRVRTTPRGAPKAPRPYEI